MAQRNDLPCLFTPKLTHRKGGRRFGGYLTAKGAKAFEAARKELEKQAGVTGVSDPDVIEASVRAESVKFKK